jgi:hypothetical protein
MDLVRVSRENGTILASMSSMDASTVSNLCELLLKQVITSAAPLGLNGKDTLCFAALSTTLLESARSAAPVEDLQTILSEQGLEGPVADTVSKFYGDKRDILIRYIEKSGIPTSEIVDVDWRIDYSVRSRFGGRDNVPMFFVSLKVKDTGRPENGDSNTEGNQGAKFQKIDVVFTQEEMQSFLAKIKDALKETTRVLNTADASQR